MSSGTTERTPSLEGFERLFAFLDADTERAAAKYEQVRLRLLKLFAWRGCTPANEFVDRTVERVIRRVSDGSEHTVAEPYQYFYGVAMAVLRDSGGPHADSETAAAESSPADPNASAPAAPRPADHPEVAADARRRLPALRASLDELAPAYRYLVLDYHRSRSATWRDELAATHGVPLTALRLRVHRLRSALEKSVAKRLSARAEDARSDVASTSSVHPQEAAQ